MTINNNKHLWRNDDAFVIIVNDTVEVTIERGKVSVFHVDKSKQIKVQYKHRVGWKEGEDDEGTEMIDGITFNETIQSVVIK